LYVEAKDIIRSKFLELMKNPPRMLFQLEDANLSVGATMQYMAEYLFVATWMLAENLTDLDSSTCSEEHQDLLDNPDCNSILPIALRWARSITYQQNGIRLDRDAHLLPKIEVGLQVGPDYNHDADLLVVHMIDAVFVSEHSSMRGMRYDLRLVHGT
jgi:hypothetical protein